MTSLRSSAAYPIAVAYAAVFAWVLLLLGACVYWGANAEFVRQQDREITEELHRLAREGNRTELLRELGWRKAQRPTYRFGYALFDRRGKRVDGTLDIARPGLGLGDLDHADGAENGQLTRAGAIDLADGSRLVVAAKSELIDRIKHTILRLFLLAVIVILLISAIGALVLGYYLNRRLTPINATANAIITGHMDWRVPVGRRGDEFDVAGQAINMMLDRIAALVENLRQVSSDIAHDLRKPLMRLLVQTDRLGNVEGAERVLELGDELLVLFSGILRIAEVEGGGIERNFEPVELSELMAEMVESFAPAVTDGGDTIQWTIEPDVSVMGNRELLAQLAANLLDNARTHTPAGTQIQFTLAASDHVAIITVEDDGAGVSDADRERLFQRFFRAEASRTNPGNGLGLSLVAAVARAHGGSVEVEDAEPGLRMLITLPKLSGPKLTEPILPVVTPD